MPQCHTAMSREGSLRERTKHQAERSPHNQLHAEGCNPELPENHGWERLRHFIDAGQNARRHDYGNQIEAGRDKSRIPIAMAGSQALT